MINLGQPITTDGIRNPNFFNGRVLSAEALKAEQSANRRQHHQLGRSVGAGVVSGLEVRLTPGSTPPTQVTVSAGLALNRRGQALALADDVVLAIAPAPPPVIVQAGLFGTCEPPQPVLTGAGVYVLAVSPASTFDGRVPSTSLTGLGPPGCGCGTTGAAGCGSAYAVEGVQFRLALVNLGTAPGVTPALLAQLNALMAQTAPAALSLLRNLLAHICLGTLTRAGFPVDPLPGGGAGTSYPYLVDPLTGLGGLTDCDVPLALVYWTTAGIQFVDMGSVRRRPLPGPPDQPWPLAPAGGLPAAGEAVSAQFQEQIGQLTDYGTDPTQLAAMAATDYFRYLPAMGLLPVGGVTGAPGVNYQVFFGGLPYRDPTFIEGATLEALARAALSYAPIDLAASELIWLYLVREHRQATDQGAVPPPRPYLVFTSGDVPHQANARFNLARWNYSNYV